MSKIFVLSFLLLLSACENTIDVKSNSLTTQPSSLALDGNGSSTVASSETTLTLTAPTEELWNEVTIDLGADFTASNICSGSTIFGRAGTALCGGWGSIWTVTPFSIDDSNVGTRTGTTFTINAPADTAYNTITLDLGSDFADSNLCVTKSILNLSGTAVCQGASGGTNASAANVLTGAYFWDSTGVSTQGSMANQGEVNLNTSAIPGAGFYSSLTLSLTASDICTGKSIFGNAGTALCNSVFADLMGSTMYRDPATAQMTLSTETSTSSYASGYRDVPDVTKDDDGYDSLSPVIKATRPATTCGTTQTTIAARVAHCLAQNPTTATWDGATKGTSSEGTWKLVTRTASAKEVWRDERTGLLWGDNAGYHSWCRASGNAQTAAQDGTGSGICDPSDPNGYGAQDSSPTSVCAETAGLSPALGNEDWGTGVYDGTKGSMGAGSTPSVRWRLPTINDYKIADANGIRFVLPSKQYMFWSASVHSFYRDFAWYFDGNLGYINVDNRYASYYAVRCVGR